jgi:hypothetical protein
VVRDWGSGDRRSRWLGMGPRLARVAASRLGDLDFGDEGVRELLFSASRVCYHATPEGVPGWAGPNRWLAFLFSFRVSFFLSNSP